MAQLEHFLCQAGHHFILNSSRVTNGAWTGLEPGDQRANWRLRTRAYQIFYAAQRIYWNQSWKKKIKLFGFFI